MKLKIIITTALLCCSILLFAMAKNITGNWTGTARINGQEDITINFVFEQDNKVLTGKGTTNVNALIHEYDIANGVVDGDSITFNVVTENNNNLLNKGKYYANGDSIGINVFVVGTGEKIGHISIKRDLSTNQK